MTLQTVFDKIFGSEIHGATQLADITHGLSTTDIKTDIILGALRNILLVCEICKTKTRQVIATTRDPKLLPNITTLPPPTTVPPPGKFS